MAFLPVGDRPVAFVDVETSGLTPHWHEVLEVGIYRPASPGGPEVTYNERVRPARIDRAEPKALEVNGYSPEAWANALEPRRVAQEINDILRDTVIVGQYTAFDVAHLQALVKDAGLRPSFGFHVIDIATLAYVMLVPRGLRALNLRAICEALDVPPEPGVHRAINGAQTARACYERLVAMCQGGGR